jgi:hypothetical protein
VILVTHLNVSDCNKIAQKQRDCMTCKFNCPYRQTADIRAGVQKAVVLGGRQPLFATISRENQIKPMGVELAVDDFGTG